MKRIYHHYKEWEDVKLGFYKRPKNVNSEELINKAINLLCSENDLYLTMEQVCLEWKISCEVNFTNIHCNQQAWLGQAACFLKHGITDKLTKEAWRRLNNVQREKANKIADSIIKKWNDSRGVK